MSYTDFTYDEGSIRKHLLKTYMWMFAGVLVTFATAFFCASNINFIYAIYTSRFLYLALIIAQFGVVIALSSRLLKMSTGACTALFFAYAILTGITFSGIFIAYSLGVIAFAFLCAAVFYGCLVVIGLVTQRDLSGIGTICIAALFAMIIYTLIAMLFNMPTYGIMYSVIGLLIFCGITAWDSQKAKRLVSNYMYDSEMINKLSVYSAFELYLDFINIFLYILRIFGNRRN